MKKILLIVISLLLLAGCAKKFPPQINEGEAFSKQPFIVQGNLQYRIKEYRRGINENVTPAQEYITFLVEAKNVGTNPDKTNSDTVRLQNGKQLISVANPKSSKHFRIELKPQETLEDWMVFDVSKKLKSPIYLTISKGKIRINLR